MGDVTLMLDAAGRGDAQASAELLPLVYEELRRLARQRMSCERAGQTLQATALVHEAWLRLIGNDRAHWQSRRHFFAAAAEAMRRILIDNARRKMAARHGGGLERVDMDGLEVPDLVRDEVELLAVHEALEKLTAHDARKAELVKLRYFAGFTLTEAAGILGISEPTAKRDWAYARSWLYREIQLSHS